MRSAPKAVLLISAAAVVVLTLAGRGLDRSATATSQTVEMSFATIDTIGLLEQMLQTPEYQGPRDNSRDAFQAQMARMQNLNAALEQQLRSMDQNDPNFQLSYSQYQNQQMQMQELGGQFGQEIDTIAADQAAEIYAAITVAVDTVAAREGIDHVVSNRVAPDASVALGLAGVTQQILARPMIRTNAADLTVAVREEMGLPDPAIAAAEAAAAAAAEVAAAEAAAQVEAFRAAVEASDAAAAEAEPQTDDDASDVQEEDSDAEGHGHSHDEDGEG